ncbi:two-component system sensor histidine kinase KdpD [Rugamonas apoptosis]|uniref:histidine kinase n=1 Tax=Rugamonas apoptosis TaxID=2758570 RepID=A0A7W2FAP6_9BURK|nr:two-component system sensor histidine kinase KdpD [Rugamonas apoptosis]MBA5688167.1 two-component system sensor histidine kinase KdbD [Rugamonas apoptosis]
MFPNDSERPDPDALLAQVQAQERKAARGKLRIYFGASAGVGKTYAMLAAARKLQADGQPVLVGVIETHGRSETAAMLEGLDVLPLRQLDYRGKQLAEFDIDAALARRPPLILIDELAHSNAPGSRHPKRWQDVGELLDAGIDVLTTVNVQHLESLNDVVGGITGIRVAETLPDTVFDEADEVVLVDLPADELLARLKGGKVYQQQQAERASQNFFRKGNLIALRELALRRTADRIEGDVRAYRVEQSIGDIWKTGAALLACVGPRPGAEHTVRSTARLASQLGTAWHAVYVETPALQRLPAGERERILNTLKLAESLGATTAVLSGEDVAAAVADYARGHNLSKIVMARRQRRHRWPARHSHLRRVAEQAPEIDLIEIGAPRQDEQPAPPRARADADGDGEEDDSKRMAGYLWAGAASLATALLATPMLAYLDLANIAMLFLLAVLLVAVRFGRGPSVVATCVSVACFDFFFVPPRFTFAISDLQYLVTFAVMLAVGLITGHLTAGLRFQAHVASRREARSRALYEYARELSGALQTEQIFEITQRFIQSAFRARATLLVPDAGGRLKLPPQDPSDAAAMAHMAVFDAGIAQWAFDHAECAGLGTDTLPASRIFYLPLVAPMRTRGVLAIQPEHRRWIMVPEQRQHLDTFATLAAIALERVHYIEVAQDALVNMESERLRNSLLAALSHDLRTPLTSLVGMSESLAGSRPPLAPPQLALADALHDEARRMSALVSNLLDMARIQSGDVTFNLQWQPLEEVVGSALRVSGAQLAAHVVATRLAPDLPLLRFDAVLIERVLCNLLENAAKYTPPGSHVTVAAEPRGTWVDVMVYDDGPGLPHGREEAIFEKFTRGERESAKPGVGLGLAICRAIVEAHGGKINAASSPAGGAAFVFSLPVGSPPPLPEPEPEPEPERPGLTDE